MKFIDNITKTIDAYKQIKSNSYKINLETSSKEESTDITKFVKQTFVIVFLFGVVSSIATAFFSYRHIKAAYKIAEVKKDLENIKQELVLCSYESAMAKVNLKRCTDNKPQIDLITE